MHRRYIRCLERVREHGDVHARTRELGELLDTFRTRYEVRRHQLELALWTVDDFFESIPEQSGIARARETFGGIVAHHMHGRPLESQIALEQVAHERSGGDGMNVFHTGGIVLDPVRD